MIVKRVDEASFIRRQFGVLEDYLADKKLGADRKKFIKSLAPNECLALVSKNGRSVLFVRGFDYTRRPDGIVCKALGFYQMQLSQRWSLPMIQHFAAESRMPFTIQNYKSFEEIFPKIVDAGNTFVRKAVAS